MRLIAKWSVYLYFCEYLLTHFPVSHRGWKGANKSLPDRFSFRSRCLRPVGEASQTCNRLFDKVRFSYLDIDFNKRLTDQQMVRHNTSSSCSRYYYSRRSAKTHHAFTVTAPSQPFRFLRTSASTSNTNTSRSLPRIRPQRTQDLPPLLHRYRPNIPPPPWTATQTWSRLAHSKMVRARNPNPRRRRARP